LLPSTFQGCREGLRATANIAQRSGKVKAQAFHEFNTQLATP
jgi:hypothetical protein